MTSQSIGYARVSTQNQRLDTQKARLLEAGCTRIFSEQLSGSTTNREELNSALDFVRESDTLVVTKLDRLARSAVDLGNIAGLLERKGVDLIVLDQNIDTTTATGKLMFNMIASFAEFERSLINERCREGIEKAKKRGVKFGRPAKLTKHQLRLLKSDFDQGEMGKQQIADKYAISKASVYRLRSIMG